MNALTMATPLGIPGNVGGFDYASLLDAVTDPVVRRTRSTMGLLDGYLGSFVTSAGRQYAQLCDLFVIVAIQQRQVARGRAWMDWEPLLTDRVHTALDGLGLPGGHTGSPERVPGQVRGVYRFWWTALQDALCARWFGICPPRDHALDDRMARCGVQTYVTSSSTWEELAGIHQAWAVYRDPGTWRAAPELLIRHCVAPHLAGELHWQVTRRPRHRVDRHGPPPDPHEPLLRRSILTAAARSSVERGLLDELLLLLRDELDRLLLCGNGPTDDRNRDLYRRTLAAINANHPDDPIRWLHR